MALLLPACALCMWSDSCPLLPRSFADTTWQGSALVDLIMVPAPGQEPFLPQKGDRLGVHVADRRSAKEDVLHREVNCINVEEVLSTVEQMKAKGAAKRFALWTDPLHSWTWGVDEATGRWCLQRARARLMLMRCFNELSEGIIAQIMAA